MRRKISKVNSLRARKCVRIGTSGKGLLRRGPGPRAVAAAGDVGTSET